MQEPLKLRTIVNETDVSEVFEDARKMLPDLEGLKMNSAINISIGLTILAALVIYAATV